MEVISPQTSEEKEVDRVLAVCQDQVGSLVHLGLNASAVLNVRQCAYGQAQRP